jgi:hypothetical protein
MGWLHTAVCGGDPETLMSNAPSPIDTRQSKASVVIGQRLKRAAVATLDDAERARIARAAELEDVDALVAMIEEIEDPDDPRSSPRKMAVVERLAELGTPEAISALGEFSASQDWELAALACWQLGDVVDSDNAIPYLMRALDDARRWEIRTNAAWGLARRRHREAYPKIIALLRSDRPAERAMAARSLALTGDRSLEPELRRARRREWRPWARWSMPRRVGRIRAP